MTFFHFLHYLHSFLSPLGISSELLTQQEFATILSEVSGKPIQSLYRTPSELIALGYYPVLVRAEELHNEVTYDIDIEETKSYGVKIQSVREWVQEHKDEIAFGKN